MLVEYLFKKTESLRDPFYCPSARHQPSSQANLELIR